MGLRPDITSLLKVQMRDALLAGFGERLGGTPCEDIARHPQYVDLLVEYFSAYAGEQGLEIRAEALERRLDETRELVRVLCRGHDMTEDQACLMREIMQRKL